MFKKLCYHLTDIFYLIFLRDNNGLNWRKAFDMKTSIDAGFLMRGPNRQLFMWLVVSY